MPFLLWTSLPPDHGTTLEPPPLSTTTPETPLNPDFVPGIPIRERGTGATRRWIVSRHPSSSLAELDRKPFLGPEVEGKAVETLSKREVLQTSPLFLR